MFFPLTGVFHADFLTQVKYQLTLKNGHEKTSAKHNLCLDLEFVRPHHWGGCRYGLCAIRASSVLRMEPVSYSSYRKSASAYDRSVDSNGRSNFFTRWWNQPELEFIEFSENRTAEVLFLTPHGRRITKEVQLIEVGLTNTGNDDAFEPEIRVLVRTESPKGKHLLGMFAFKKMANLLSYRVVNTLSEEPDESEFAVTFLEHALQNVPPLAGHSTQYMVLGFAFKGGSLFHFASEDVLTLLSLSIDRDAPPQDFELRAKAKNSSEAVLCERAVLTTADYNALNLVRA